MSERRTPAPFSADYQRMWDLVRHQRAELLDADLITKEEYAELLIVETKGKPGQGSPSPRRLESYDEVRRRLAAAEARATAAEQALQEMRAIRSRFRAGESAEELAADYQVPVEWVARVCDPGYDLLSGEGDEPEAVMRRWHMAFNAALRAQTGKHFPACDGPDCSICLYAASAMTRQRRQPAPPLSAPSTPEDR